MDIIQLGKLDKSLQCVERIKERIAEESRISRLGIPSLVFYFSLFVRSGIALDLHVEIEDELQLEYFGLVPRMASHLPRRLLKRSGPINIAGRSSWGEIAN